MNFESRIVLFQICVCIYIDLLGVYNDILYFYQRESIRFYILYNNLILE